MGTIANTFSDYNKMKQKITEVNWKKSTNTYNAQKCTRMHALVHQCISLKGYNKTGLQENV